MKKACLIISLCALCCASRAVTNEYISTLTGEETDRRLGVVTNTEVIVSNLNIVVSAFTNNLKTSVYDSGMADVGFYSSLVTTGITAAALTSLNLSSYIGTNQGIAVLRIFGNTASDVRFRPPAETNSMTAQPYHEGAFGGLADANTQIYLLAITDENGIVKIYSSGSVRITIVAFIRRHVFE